MDNSQQWRCWCETCRPITMDDMRMVLCPTCGNKRCPHATNHWNACTGSNEVGQPGSSWEQFMLWPGNVKREATNMRPHGRLTGPMIHKAWRECGALSNSPPDWAIQFAQNIAALLESAK